MRLKIILSIFTILSVLLGACQAGAPSEATEAYPIPGDVPVVQDTAYPAQEDLPLVQETSNPYPGVEDQPADSAPEPAYVPRPEDASLSVGTAFPNLETSEILLLETYPVQVNLVLRGELPTPCNQLRVKVTGPDAQNSMQVEVYSVVDSNMVCTQVIEPFETQVALGSFESGKYSVYVNGEFLGEFTI